MALPVLICDDSGFARKQLARSLPRDWDVDIHFAANGAEALAAIEAGQGDLLFLDLNMPVMDGYQVLEAVKARDLPTLIIVVSGDVQEQARTRVLQLGALDFITKPVNAAQVERILERFGMLHELQGVRREELDLDFEPLEGYQEVANVAMGQAAALLAQVLGAFVDLPVPRAQRLAPAGLQKRVSSLGRTRKHSLVSQGFVGCGVAGEALLLVGDHQLDALGSLLETAEPLSPPLELDMLMDISNLVIGACLSSFCQQLDLGFSLGHPVVVARSRNFAEEAPFASAQNSDEDFLCLEIHYGIEQYQMNFHLLLVFSEASLAVLDERIGFLVEN